MKKEVFLVLILFLVSGCFKGNNSDKCVPVGCSSQLCVSSDKTDIITTCEFKEEYNCLKLTSCEYVDDGCKWVENQEYLDCLEGVGK